MRPSLRNLAYGLIQGLGWIGVFALIGASLLLVRRMGFPAVLLLGLIASRRATRSTVASWRDYWREMTYLTVAVVIGAIVALAAATKILDESLVEWQLAHL